MYTSAALAFLHHLQPPRDRLHGHASTWTGERNLHEHRRSDSRLLLDVVLVGACYVPRRPKWLSMLACVHTYCMATWYIQPIRLTGPGLQYLQGSRKRINCCHCWHCWIVSSSRLGPKLRLPEMFATQRCPGLSGASNKTVAFILTSEGSWLTALSSSLCPKRAPL